MAQPRDAVARVLAISVEEDRALHHSDGCDRRVRFSPLGRLWALRGACPCAPAGAGDVDRPRGPGQQRVLRARARPVR
eukprot:193827-Lingulodinium_polyedra.AAC.1